MKLTRIALSAVCAAFVFGLSACGAATETNNNKPAANNSNTAVNSKPAVENKTTPAANSPSNSNVNSAVNKPVSQKKTEENADAEAISGELQVGKTESVILYFGEESGDYAGYCFTNDSEAGRAILAACKDKEQCEIKGTVDYEVKCDVPGLEADLSASGRILKVNSAKKAARK